MCLGPSKSRLVLRHPRPTDWPDDSAPSVTDGMMDKMRIVRLNELVVSVGLWCFKVFSCKDYSIYG